MTLNLRRRARGVRVWLVTLPGVIGPIALVRDDYPASYADAGWIVEGPLVPEDGNGAHAA